MAIELPRLKRLDPPVPESSGQIRATSADPTRAFAQVSGKLNNLVGNIAEQVHKQELQAAEDAADAADIELRTRAEELLGKAKQNTGDPTNEYAEIEKDLESFANTRKNNPEVSQVTRNALKRKLDDSLGRINIQRIADFNVRNANYQDQLFTDGIKLDQRNQVDYASLVEAGDESSLALFENGIDKIIGRVREYGLKRGTITTDENGKQVWSKPAEYMVKKALGDSIHASIEALADAGAFDKAEFVRDKYKDFMDPGQRSNLDKKFKAGAVTARAHEMVARLQNGEPMSILDDEPVAVQLEATEAWDHLTRRRDNDRKRVSDANYNAALSIVVKARENDQFITWGGLKNNKDFMGFYNGITDAKERQALREVIERPAESDPNVKAAVLEMDANGDFRGMPIGELQKHLIGLKESDASMFQNNWLRDNKDTEAEQRAQETRMMKQIRGAAIGTLVKPFRGNISNRDLAYLNDLYSNISRELERLPKMSVSDQNEWINKVIADQVKANAKRRGQFIPPDPSYAPKKRVSADLPAEAKKKFVDLPQELQDKVDAAFSAKYPDVADPTEAQLDEFYQKEFTE